MNRGFTLIELIVVVVVLGILAIVAAPRFLGITDDARRAVFDGYYGSFSSAISLSHSCWIVRGAGTDDLNLECGNDDRLNALDYNIHGYPVGTLENASEKSINNDHDCALVWDGLMNSEVGIWTDGDSRDPFVSRDEATIETNYVNNQTCRYNLINDADEAFEYNSVSGSVYRL